MNDAKEPDRDAAGASDSRMRNLELFTLGHSNHTLEQFLALLERHRIQALADIRRFPGSRTFPHFQQETLSAALRERGVEYHWIEELGGRRSRQEAPESSRNSAWRNQSFRNYADYMLTEKFRSGVARLCELAADRRTAMMCSESVYWRCHRRLVSDYLAAHGASVQHIFPNGDLKPHRLTEDARIEDGDVTYPGQTLF